jgi:hypothetical protein
MGDLAYIPSGAYLYKLEGLVPVKWEELECPMSLLVCGDNARFYKVFYRGSIWHGYKEVMTLLQRGEK